MKIKWDQEAVWIKAKECETFCEFRQKHSQGYKVAKRLGILKEVQTSFRYKNKFQIYTFDIVLSLAYACFTYQDFRQKHPGPYQQAFQQGWLLEIKDRINKKILKEVSVEDALNMGQILSKKDFKAKHPREYQALVLTENLGELEKRQKKLVKQSKHSIRYSDQEVRLRALGYSSRMAFGEFDPGAYQAALRRGIIDEVCDHMDKKINFMEEYVRVAFEYVYKEKFSNTKPHFLINPLTGRKMELDGYSEKLSIAFEYQGPQHFEGGKFFSKEVRNKDEIKKRTCHQRGIKLFEFKAKTVVKLRQELISALELEDLPYFVIG